MDLYLGSEETMSLYGIKTDGLYYVRDGMVNKYAMTFQHQVGCIVLYFTVLYCTVLYCPFGTRYTILY